MTAIRARTGEREENRSLGELLKAATGEIQHLLRAEVQLARIETREELARAGDVAKHGAIAAGAAFFALLLLSFAAAWGLAEVMPIGVAFLIVGVLYAIVAGVAALVARERMRRVDFVPRQTVETLEEDAQWLRTRSK